MEEKEREALVVMRNASNGVEVVRNIVQFFSWLFVIAGVILLFYGVFEYEDICLTLSPFFLVIGIINLMYIPKLLNGLGAIVSCAEEVTALINRDNRVINKVKED